MQLSAFILSLISLVTTPPSSPPPRTVTLEECQVYLAEEAELPAQEAGVITKLAVELGDVVGKDDLVAQIDDSIPRMQVEVAEAKFAAADLEAESRIPEEYSRAAAAVAKADWNRSRLANERMPNAVPQAIVDQQALAWEEKDKSTQKAILDRQIAGKQRDVARSEKKAAETSLKRRELHSPLEGEICRINVHEGEWVQPGDAVMHVVRMNRLRIKGDLPIANISPSEVKGKPVSVEVVLTRGRVKTFSGKIVFVDPILLNTGDCLVVADITNEKEDGEWLLRPGMSAKMTIHIR